MTNLHVDPSFLGKILINPRGDKRRIYAAWLENKETYYYKEPVVSKNLVVLTVDTRSGACYKVILPDLNWEFQLPLP